MNEIKVEQAVFDRDDRVYWLSSSLFLSTLCHMAWVQTSEMFLSSTAAIGV